MISEEELRFQKFLDEELEPVIPTEQFLSVTTWYHWAVAACPGLSLPIIETQDDSVLVIWKKKNTFVEIEVFRNGDLEWLISDQCQHKSGQKDYTQILPDQDCQTIIQTLEKIRSLQ